MLRRGGPLRSFAVLMAALLLIAGGATAQAALDLSKDDPRGDVIEVTASGSSGGGQGSFRNVEGHADVDLVGVTTRDDGASLVLVLRVAGRINDSAGGSFGDGGFAAGGFGYNAALDVRGDLAEEYEMSYAAGDAKLTDRSNNRNVRVQSSHAGGALTVTVPKSDLGTITKFNFTASAVETRGTYQSGQYASTTYVDVIGPHPGHEGVYDFQAGAMRGKGPSGGSGVGFGTPGPGVLSLVAVAAVAAMLAARRRA